MLLAGEEDLPRSLGEGVNFSGVFYRDEGLICWKDDLLLLVPADLGAPLVLADTASFADFGTVVTVSPDGSRVWYVEENDKIGIYGLAAFRPGESKREREIRLTFDGVLAASGESVLLWRRIGGETVFTLLSLATEQAVSLTVDAAPGLVSLSPGNGRLALWDAGKGALRIWNVQTGGELEVQETSELGEAVALCYSGDGALYVSFRRDNGEILATLE